jgi:hypothetical protein
MRISELKKRKVKKKLKTPACSTKHVYPGYTLSCDRRSRTFTLLKCIPPPNESVNGMDWRAFLENTKFKIAPNGHYFEGALRGTYTLKAPL